MKQRMLFALACLACLLQARAYDFIEGGFYYTILSEEEKTVAVACGNTEKITYSNAVPEGMMRDLYYDPFMLWTGNSYSGDLIIPESVTRSSDGVTYRVTEIGEAAFINCSELTSITIPSTITALQQGAFWGCSALSEITVPDSVTTIENCAFTNCTGIKKLKYSLSVNYIAEECFTGCGAPVGFTLTGVDNVTYIDFRAFVGATLSHYPSWKSIEYLFFDSFLGSKICEAYINKGIAAFSPFDNCNNLRILEIEDFDPELDRCSEKMAVTKLKIHNVEPPVLTQNLATYMGPDCVLYVPAGSEEAYRQAEYWRNFTEIRGFASASVETPGNSALRAWCVDGGIMTSGQEAVTVTSISGIQLYQGKAGFVALPDGIYIVTTGKETVKVVVN